MQKKIQPIPVTDQLNSKVQIRSTSSFYILSTLIIPMINIALPRSIFAFTHRRLFFLFNSPLPPPMTPKRLAPRPDHRPSDCVYSVAPQIPRCLLSLVVVHRSSPLPTHRPTELWITSSRSSPQSHRCQRRPEASP